MPKISIIMPTYKVEQYLKQCLDSVVNQTLKDIEIIPVNDGSPDSCGQIIDEYAARDPRIKPIHQENGGYGKAVNAGINAAIGEYIGIVETDDFCEPTMFEELYRRAKELDADVCKCDFNYYYGEKKGYESYNKMKTVAKEGEIFTIKENPRIFRYHVSIWSAIYRREYLNKFNIRVEESKSASYQDMPFAALVYAKGAKITVIHKHLINYRAEDGMNSSTIRTDGRLKMMPIQCSIAKEIFKENDCWDEVKEIAYRHFFNCSVGMFLHTDPEFKKSHYEELVKLFGDMDKEGIKYKYINRKQKKFLKLIIRQESDKVISCSKDFFIGTSKKLRRKIIRFKISKEAKYLVLFGKMVWEG